MFAGCTKLPNYGLEGVDTNINMARTDNLDGKMGFFISPEAGVYHYDDRKDELQLMTLEEANCDNIIPDGAVPRCGAVNEDGIIISPFAAYAATTTSVTSTSTFSS